MSWLALQAAVTALAAAQPIEESAPPLRGPAVIVLWASWCTACKAEVARLPRIAAAAAPLPIRTLAIDPPARARAVLVARGQPTAGAFADPRDPRTVLDAWGGAGSALPVAVAIDARGQVCGRKLGLLGTDQLKQWAAACR